jgi:ABC-type antimicrobial peptide transport system permease subunit
MVAQSGREFALRLAIGAEASSLLRVVMSKGLALAAAGAALGAVAAMGLTRLMGYMLYNVSPYDPVAYGTAFLVIGLASMAACLAPAVRATRMDPLQALRE